jgi:thiamine pyrophosphokinase
MPAEGRTRSALKPSLAEGFLMDKLRAWIFANGELKRPEAVFQKIKADDLIIAADGGYAHLRRKGLLPGLVIGDLDSMDPQDLDRLSSAGVGIQKFPAEKDETDLELAITAALQAGASEIRICAALGGRFDQQLGNLFLLGRADLAEKDIRLEDGETEVFLVRSACLVEGQEGDTVSLLPMGAAAHGVRTRGLRYPLNGETLYPEWTRGISNELLAEQGQVSLERGILVLVHIRKKSFQ